MSALVKRAAFGSLSAAFLAYSGYVYTAGTEVPKPVSVTEQVSAGHRVFQDKNCTACHQIYGLGGYMGPDLTNVISTTGKGPDYARVFVQNGTERMPNFGLTTEEVDAVIAFLEYVDAPGKYPAQKYRISWYGTTEASHE